MRVYFIALPGQVYSSPYSFRLSTLAHYPSTDEASIDDRNLIASQLGIKTVLDLRTK